MTHPPYIREKAIELRLRGLTLDEIAERLALNKTTVYYWIKDIPIPRRPRRATAGRRRGSEKMVATFAAKRQAAYEQGRTEFEGLAAQPTFIDFVCMYIGEGSKRNRNRVAIGNSDPLVVLLAHHWLERLSAREQRFGLQYHADQDPDDLRAFWGTQLGIDPRRIALQRKSNSNHLTGRTWRSEHGVLTVVVNDTYLRARLEAWIDLTKARWLDSRGIGV